ncbi:helix-turn-helix domain-containing protein [Mesorhizobium sp. CO1-1-8]|uniref:helix-turn-helix domain-containing protein n=1 Tax=Mesorhizobium sp. CO1-1-8 TaxID=2876631 RepID=UPI001CD08248|nr:helix-turn-helix transcriptional regulator [Mesorhizobium sp. CO1-1-8]MBZ9777031.1 helix-turn-helix domain-containing protein [Mesorhizobium sp. CO1-1-8]
MSENEELAQDVKAWRAKEGFTAEAAAKMLGIPKRTYEGIEQGRGFPYPLLLRAAMKAMLSRQYRRNLRVRISRGGSA